MTYITGSITNANPGPTLYALIETAALADGWTLDDTVVIGANTHKVLKSAAAGNTYALDWYLDINYPTTGTTGGIRFTPFEGYTAATDLALRGPRSGASDTTIDATTYSRYGLTASALETNWANTTAYTTMSVVLSAAATTYWISITRNRIIVLLSSAPTQLAYAGFYTPLSSVSTWAGAALFPLITTVIPATAIAVASTTASTTAASLTRLPKATTVQWGTHVSVQGLIPLNYVGGQAGTAVSPFTGEVAIVPLPIVAGGTSVNAASGNTTAFIGNLDGVATGFVAGTTVRGDTLTIGADTWISHTISSSQAVFFKAV